MVVGRDGQIVLNFNPAPQGPHAPWKSPTTAVLTLLLMVGVAFAAVWCVVQCRTRRYCRNFRKEPLPHSLVSWGGC